MPRKPRKKTHGVQIEFRGPDGARYCKTWPTKEAALEWKRQVLSDIARGSLKMPTKSRFPELWKEFLEGKKAGRSKSTQDAYESYGRSHFANLWPDRIAHEIEKSDVEKWAMEKVEEGLAGTTVKRLVEVLRAVFNYALGRGRIVRNPATKASIPKGKNKRDIRMLTDEEVRLVIAGCRTMRVRTLVLLALNTGMRLGEMMAMQWGWINAPRGVIRIPASVEAGFIPKGKKEREITLLPDLADALAAWLQHQVAVLQAARAKAGAKKSKELADLEAGRGPIFTGINWRRWAKALRLRTARLRIEEQRVNLKELDASARKELLRSLAVPFRWHALRHTYISRLVMAGISLRIVQFLAGHASITTTERYAHLAPNMHELVLARFPAGIVTVRPMAGSQSLS